ncbi:MAG: hypothetical protein A3F77_04910 [Betaproteobacteria bacterium RIFCSPLOWO2_12_FULL_67_28]|nr:MAG: hypothetical protein A3F77_04910 [Betaproteobacteria bacterium RIFCSPLOWO2_12_FULL_67_28]
MLCAKCRHDNPAATKFCGECGARLAAVCALCSASNPPGNRFCGGCGAALGAREPVRAAPPPRHLAERILQSRAALEGERKQVTARSNSSSSSGRRRAASRCCGTCGT